MPKLHTSLGCLLAWACVLTPLARAPLARAQDVRPLLPVLEPVEPPEPPAEPGGLEIIALPRATSRAEAASGDRVRVAAVLPASWSAVAAGYQPYWSGVAPADGFGLQLWAGHFAASAIVPAVTPHPFFSPWGMLAYEGRLFENYRALWTGPGTADLAGEAARWLQRGDHAMASGRAPEAAHAYRRVTLAAPDFPLGYLGLGAALAELGDDEPAAMAFRQGLDHYPPWLPLEIDWSRLWVDPDRLAGIQTAAARRAVRGAPASRFTAGVLHLLGGRSDSGRELLDDLTGDAHAALLLSHR